MTTPGFTSIHVPVDDIDVGERDRSDMGDLAELAESIDSVGMLHPIVITGEWRLVAGDRRLAAVRDVLGWREVPVTVVDLVTAADVLRAEMDENTCRQPLTPVEAERARARRAHLLVDDAVRRAEEGRARGRAAQAALVSSNLDETDAAEIEPEPESPSARATRKVAAVGTGYSGSTLDKVTSIREVAERGVIRIAGQDLPAPEPVREIARSAMENLAKPGAPVDRLHREVAAAIEAHVEPDEQAQRARHLRLWREALAGARLFREFDMGVLSSAMSEKDWDLAAERVDEIAAQVERFRELRPTQLRMVSGQP